ncbi:MAG: cytochrome c class III, partial [Deltaproteobacteria bacterium]|nr:cytochrome c class III [Deltaproteobacteria bacterium]
CTTCHHQTTKACSECHTVLASEEGDGVNLETAHHDTGSDRSCVGCHQREALEPDCAGCHATLPRPPSESTCAVCHTGPPGESAARPELAPLPPTSDDDFPDVIVIELLAADYEASEMPHAKIVEHLDALVRDSELAAAFHPTTEVLCSGCHHHSPVGERPPGCGSCHDLESHPTEDQPSLKAAYHRQCLGCHEEMGLEQVGCTDCHADANQEDSP